MTDTPGYDAEGSYSPDGKRIIFTSFRDGDAEIYIMDADGKNPRRITHSKGYDGGPFFAPDGKRIIYRSDRKQNDLLQVFINNDEGTAERALTDNDAVNWGPFFHPDGRHIVYSTSLHGHQNYEIYLMDVETGLQDRVTYRDGFDGLPVFSNDGAKLLWTSKGRNPENTSQLYLADFTLTPALRAELSGFRAAALTVGAANSRFLFRDLFMNAKDAIVQVLATADRVVNAYLADLSDADLLVRPIPGQNHIAWQLGHLISSERSFIEAMKPGFCPPLPEGFEAAHGRDEASVASDDPRGSCRSKGIWTFGKLSARRRSPTSTLSLTPISTAPDLSGCCRCGRRSARCSCSPAVTC